MAAGELAPQDVLPPVRALAEKLNANRNTVAAAYRQLVTAGQAEERGRGGTIVAGLPQLAGEGAWFGSRLTDLASGDPDPQPDTRHARGGRRDRAAAERLPDPRRCGRRRRAGNARTRCEQKSWFSDPRFVDAVGAGALAEAVMRTMDYGHDLDTEEMRAEAHRFLSSEAQ